MKNDIDKLVNVAITRRKDKFDPVSRVSENEPSFVITKHWFKKWKTVKYEFKDSHSAVGKFNETMERLQNCLNIEIDFKRSDVIKNDISTPLSQYCDFVYIVQVFWRNVK
jgi:hypothetical protein